ncbi:hypothetical protein A4U88_4159 [Serratia marcescens]|nr:hypothetical protein A4U88_4159 [Serratia marcescens]
MFSLDSLLQDAFPHRNTPAWQRSLLRTLLFEKEFKQFAADYPHLKGLDLIEQVVDYFNLSCELVDGDLENIPSQGRWCSWPITRSARSTAWYCCAPLPRCART